MPRTHKSALLDAFHAAYCGGKLSSTNRLVDVIVSRHCLGTGQTEQLLSSHSLVRLHPGLMQDIQYRTDDLPEYFVKRNASHFKSLWHTCTLGSSEDGPLSDFHIVPDAAYSTAGPDGFETPQMVVDMMNGKICTRVGGVVSRMAEIPGMACCRDARKLEFHVCTFTSNQVCVPLFCVCVCWISKIMQTHALTLVSSLLLHRWTCARTCAWPW